MGQSDEDNPYQKSTSLHVSSLFSALGLIWQSWLFGYEFPGMTMLLTPDKIYFATSVAKGMGHRLDPLTRIAKHLETLVGKDGGVPLEILKRTKDEEVNKRTFQDIITALTAAGVCFPTRMYLTGRTKSEFSQRTNSKANLWLNGKRVINLSKLSLKNMMCLLGLPWL